MDTPGIDVTNLTISFAQKCLFDDLDFSLVMGDKVTIVGENGCGKTTFLRLLSGVEYSYSGTIDVEGRVGFLPQHFEDITRGEESAIVTLLRSLKDTEMNNFLEQPYRPLSSEWYHELNSLGGHEIFRQANLLGLGGDLLEKPFTQLSGGEKTKTMLCALSIAETDIILLDEPTNHLDTQGIVWLENFLKEYTGGIIMVTHDRSLINAVSNRISELTPKKFVHFRGGYDNYLEQEEKKRKKLLLERHQQEKEMKVLKQKSIQLKSKMKDKKIRDSWDRDKLSHNNQEHRVQMGNTKAYNQLTRKQEHLSDAMVEVIPERAKILFEFEDTSVSSLCVEVSDIAKAYSKLLFSHLSFTLVSGDRLIIQGPNGTGKSTLLKIIMDSTLADDGDVHVESSAVVGYLDQEQESLPLDKTAIEFLMEDPKIRCTKKKAIASLVNLGIYSWHDLTNPMKDLSIGCRRKVQLCQIIMRRSTIILLDEPSNHIDFPSLEVIEEALTSFPGIIIAATHDRRFTEKVGTKTLNIGDYKN
ncbi:P-loop containing nucleoside triphosphate hydrolase protein [Conidiobolus coronatus NRRL 28638]|uniref:p-loop containing nucleoside triphosphate hydrolase protein n=1 Tax=Conidiobolus coronatus (strain ATCC 28846 / CBS 209.66 / NRRL 28638) TaxID=796925 RepID=A0A137P0M5_CONC2|nr:P-loop containing nucleoside triphosphate hydrolase protein [Conidiobolus coronatus NRRL 28638]|eukprot:KXN68577.1 P-loop containing nucleoside triphosphate hydrolase protein [Conidiobolus coronatus NRRL 28638]